MEERPGDWRNEEETANVQVCIVLSWLGFLLLQLNTMTTKQPGGGGGMQLTLPQHCLLRKEVRTSTQTGQGLGGRS